MNTLQKAQRIIRAGINAAKTADGKSRVEAINLHTNGYAEPGCSDPASGVIATGNWNNITRLHDGGHFEIIDNTPSRVAHLLARLGVEMEWADEWTACDFCGKVIRTKPDFYSWQPSYFQDDDANIHCRECLDPELYLLALEGDPARCNSFRSIRPEEYGYIAVLTGLEHGFHEGQDADPNAIAEALDQQGITRYLFNLDSTSQFDLSFSVHVHESEIEKIDGQRLNDASKSGPSMTGDLRRGLEEAARQMDALPPKGIKHATVHRNGKVTVRVYRPDEFGT